MTEIKQTAESPQAVPVERPAETAELAHVERVTKKKAKGPKKVAAGRAGAAGLARWRFGVAPRSLTLRPATLAWSWWTSLSPERSKTCKLDRGSFQLIS